MTWIGDASGQQSWRRGSRRSASGKWQGALLLWEEEEEAAGVDWSAEQRGTLPVYAARGELLYSGASSGAGSSGEASTASSVGGQGDMGAAEVDERSKKARRG